MTSADLTAWQALIDQAARLSNDKIRDLGPLRRAARAANKAMIPDGYRFHGNAFSRLVRLALDLPADDGAKRAELMAEAGVCDAILNPVRAAAMPGDFGQLTHVHDGRKDIYG